MKQRSALARREKEVMDVIYRLGRATVSEVRAQLPNPPSYSAVRATLGVLERKGHLTHEHDGKRYDYLPTVDKQRARANALDHLTRTFFDGSPEAVVAALMESRGPELSEDALGRLSRLIEEAREEGR